MIVASVERKPLPAGVAGTKQTLLDMQEQVKACVQDPRVRAAAVGITKRAGAKGGSDREEARAIFDWVVRHVRYVHDPSYTEQCQDPRILLAQAEEGGDPAGDCNNQSCLVASLGHSIGLPISWVVVGQSPDAYQHIYPALERARPESLGFLASLFSAPVGSESDLLALDTARPHPEFGKHAHGFSTRWVVPALKGL